MGFTQRSKGGTLSEASSLFRLGRGGLTFPPSGQVHNFLSAAGAGNTADTTEDVLHTFSLPGNCLDVVGRGLVIMAWGSFANNAHSKTAKLYFGSSIVLTTGAQTSAAVGWLLELDVWKVGVNAQIGFGQPIVGTTHGGMVNYTAGVETDTASIVLKATGQTGTASAADVVLNGFSVFGMD